MSKQMIIPKAKDFLTFETKHIVNDGAVVLFEELLEAKDTGGIFDSANRSLIEHGTMLPDKIKSLSPYAPVMGKLLLISLITAPKESNMPYKVFETRIFKPFDQDLLRISNTQQNPLGRPAQKISEIIIDQSPQTPASMEVTTRDYDKVHKWGMPMSNTEFFDSGTVVDIIHDIAVRTLAELDNAGNIPQEISTTG